MLMDSNYEIVGVLFDIKEEESCSKLQFNCIREVELPASAVSQKKLASLVGKRIGIFNCDGEFFVREI